MASPEVGTDAPKVKIEELKADPEAALAEFKDDLAGKASWEVDALVQKGINAGIFKHAEGDDARADDMFDGLELQSAVPEVPEVQALIETIKSQKESAIFGEESDKIWQRVSGATDPKEKALILASLAEDAVARGAIDVTKPVPEQPAKPPQKRNGRDVPGTGKPKVDAKPAELIGHDRRQIVMQRVFNQALDWRDPADPDVEIFDAAAKATFRERLQDVGGRKDEILKHESTRNTRAREQAKKDQEARATQARKQVEDATARLEQEREVGVNRVVLPKGHIVEKPDQAAIDAGIVTKKGKLLKSVEVVDASVHDAALADHARFEQERRLGTNDEAIARAHVEALGENAEKDRQAAADAVSRLPLPDAVRHYGQELEIQGKSKAEIQELVNQAHDEAIEEAKGGKDSRVAGREAVRERYQQMIDATPDANVKRALAAERDKAMEAELKRQDDLTAERTKIIVDAHNTAQEVRGHTSAHQAFVESEPVRAGDPMAEEKALERHKALGLDAVPFLEEKKGGLFHRKKNRGPKVVEAYFTSPDNPNLIVLERRVRRSGELLSQTVMTTEKPLRKRRGGQIVLPPREVEPVVADIRANDTAAAIGRHQDTALGRELGVASASELVNWGWGSGDKIDGPKGAYARYEPDPAVFTNKVNKFKYGSHRRGGFWHATGIFK